MSRLPSDPSAAQVIGVSQLMRAARALLEASFPSIWVEGEISNVSRPASGHVYFTLKDATAQVRCALFRSRLNQCACTPVAGMHALLRGQVTLYEGRGDFQIIVHYLEDAGEGALRRAFEALKRSLAAEGLFDDARKHSLPAMPRRIGVITSASGAALRDIIATFGRRNPQIALLIYPTPVQGNDAAPGLASALALASARAECDALILARGGGSLEDLQAFNEETVARAISACRIPVVTGIGHEIDFTIADFVADRRAPTPTGAAELLSPDQAQMLAGIDARRQRLERVTVSQLQRRAQTIDWLAHRIRHPHQRLADARQHCCRTGATLVSLARMALRHHHHRLRQLEGRLRLATPRYRITRCQDRQLTLDKALIGLLQAQRTRQQQRLQLLNRALVDLNPLATLERGYAILRDDRNGAIVRDAQTIRPGQSVVADLARGQLRCRVDETLAR